MSPPTRCLFHYAWFPETWTVNGAHVFYHPTLGYYDSSQESVIDAQLAAYYPGADALCGLVSWFGPGTHQEATRVGGLFARAQFKYSPVSFGLYYEAEGYGDPTVTQLISDLTYIRDHYTFWPNYLKRGGRPVVFVYSADDSADICEVATRWAAAKAAFATNPPFIVLKLATGYQNCATQPDGWHQYSPGSTNQPQYHAGYGCSVSPGFWRADEATPRLARDLTRFVSDLAFCVGTGAPWQLVTTFNEWGEGTAVESATEWGTTYLDAIKAAW